MKNIVYVALLFGRNLLRETKNKASVEFTPLPWRPCIQHPNGFAAVCCHILYLDTGPLFKRSQYYKVALDLGSKMLYAQCIQMLYADGYGSLVLVTYIGNCGDGALCCK